MYIRTTVGSPQEPVPCSLKTRQKRSLLGFGESSEVQPRPSPAVSALQVLKRAGLTTEQWADQKAPALIQAALQQSRVLGPFLVNKLGETTIAKNYHHYGSDPEFVYAWLKLHKIVVPEQEGKRLTDNIRAFYHRPTDSIHLRPHTHFGQVLKLAIIKLSSPGFGGFFGEFLAQGVSLHFTNLVLTEQGLGPMKSVDLEDQLSCAIDLVGVAGLNLVGAAYFQSHLDLINHLTTKLSIGPVRIEELTRDGLCADKACLLRTARFASHLVRNMVGVGITEPRSVRLWMRTDVPGIHELQILGGSSATRSVRVEVPAGQAGDNTAVIPYPGSTGLPPLDPLTRYRYRIVRTGDGEWLGEGSFETPPGNDGDTPQKVVIGLLSCHQPFTERGTISPQADRMLRVLPRILRDNDVKFVLPCGDQIYADDPGNFSLFRNPYLIRQAFPNRQAVPRNIFECTDQEVRRLYDIRYRMFWSMPAIRHMRANYPCYPAMDDHEIKNGWGSDPKHAGSQFKNVLRGALDAYRDYQASSVLPAPPALGMRKSGSFHYDFSYGNIGVFVMDLRSQRYNLPPRGRQMFSPAQFDDLQIFLRNNGHKKVLLIVTSVPVVFVPGVLARTSRAIHIKESNFVDHWSHSDNVRERDAFLSLLHAHQQAHPNQRVALACGDVHIGNAFGIHWQGGRKPRLYQFTSSALTALETRTTQFLVEKGPRLVSGVTCPSTPFGGPCSARVSHLEAVNEASSHNPFTGLNVGLIEVQRLGDVSNLKFKLIGYHPQEDRPVTYFESGWLA
jgi:alkaline phosphatase D